MKTQETSGTTRPNPRHRELVIPRHPRHSCTGLLHSCFSSRCSPEGAVFAGPLLGRSYGSRATGAVEVRTRPAAIRTKTVRDYRGAPNDSANRIGVYGGKLRG